MKGKAIIVSAPSGAGKTTIVKNLLAEFPFLEFSISACSRPKRDKEVDGVDYYFISADQFRTKITNDDFIEWEEVYPGSYYGTLRSEMERIWSEKKIPIFDVDVQGGINLKKYFGDSALALFIEPPSLQILEERLRHRGTENEKSLLTRLSKVEQELSFAGSFDEIIVNDEICNATKHAIKLILNFLGGSIHKKNN